MIKYDQAIFHYLCAWLFVPSPRRRCCLLSRSRSSLSITHFHSYAFSSCRRFVRNQSDNRRTLTCVAYTQQPMRPPVDRANQNFQVQRIKNTNWLEKYSTFFVLAVVVCLWSHRTTKWPCRHVQCKIRDIMKSSLIAFLFVSESQRGRKWKYLLLIKIAAITHVADWRRGHFVYCYWANYYRSHSVVSMELFYCSKQEWWNKDRKTISLHRRDEREIETNKRSRAHGKPINICLAQILRTHTIFTLV